MGKVRYIPSQTAMDRYYLQQGRGDMPYFSGAGHQTGHGLGGLFGKLFRSAIPVFRNTVAPLLKKAGKEVAKEALTTGVGVATDLLDGQTFSSSVQHRLPTAANRMATKGANQLHHMLTGNFSPKRKRKRVSSGRRRNETLKRARKTIKGNDIFA